MGGRGATVPIHYRVKNITMKCYQCKNKDSLEELVCFCSEECKTKYNGENLKKTEVKPKLTIPEIQKRLLEIAQEVREKRRHVYQTPDVVAVAREIFNS